MRDERANTHTCRLCKSRSIDFLLLDSWTNSACRREKPQSRVSVVLRAGQIGRNRNLCVPKLATEQLEPSLTSLPAAGQRANCSRHMRSAANWAHVSTHRPGWSCSCWIFFCASRACDPSNRNRRVNTNQVQRCGRGPSCAASVMPFPSGCLLLQGYRLARTRVGIMCFRIQHKASTSGEYRIGGSARSSPALLVSASRKPALSWLQLAVNEAAPIICRSCSERDSANCSFEVLNSYLLNNFGRVHRFFDVFFVDGSSRGVSMMRAAD